MNEAFEALRARFRQRCASNRAALVELIAAQKERDIRELAHRLAGAAGTFGYPDLSVTASALEEQMADGDAPDPTLLAQLDERLASVAGGAGA